MSEPRQRERVTIIGAGPVGSLLALLLARRGIDVEVFERRPDLRREQVGAGRSINLAVSTRGLHALHQVGLDAEVLQAAVPMPGRMLHALDGATSFHRYGQGEREFINSMSRSGINALLLTAAEQAARLPGAGQVKLHFRNRLVGCDLAAGIIRLRDEATGAERTDVAKVLIGTDGSASAVRAAMEVDGSTTTQEVLDAGYKEMALPRAPGTGRGADGRFHLEPHALHIWPRGRFMLIALPNPAGDFTCTLFLPFTAPPGEPSFGRLETPEQCGAFFHAQFPDAAALIPDVGRAFREAPLGQMATVRTSPWSLGGALLLGDAAHAIVPFFGQGMNAGLEDCTLLDEQLGAALAKTPPGRGLDWTSLFAKFGQHRKPDTDAIAELALENFIEMRDRVADRGFQLQRAVEAELQKRLPGRYLTRYQLVTFSRRPYRIALEAGKIQAELLCEVCEGATRIEQVDLGRAQALAEERLLPLLEAHPG